MGDPFDTTGDALAAVHEGLRELAERRENGDALNELAAARSRMAASSFRLVVLGEYKRGKSTLVNALLGAPALPTDIVPLTSAVTEVRYATEPRAVVQFLDGRRDDIPMDGLASFVTESGNPRNAKGVERAIVELPAEFLRQGVTIVDTPGVGSVFEHNTEVTYGFLAESDAVVIVLAADQPLSSEERRLLAALAGITDHVLFAVNRTDVLTAEETARSVDFVRRALSELDAVSLERIHPISAKLALEAARRGAARPADQQAFEDSLRQILIERKREVLRARATRLTRRAADLLELGLASEASALAGERRQWTTLTDQLEAAASRAEEQIEHAAVLLRHEVRKLHEVVLRGELEAARARWANEIWPKVESELERDRARPLHRTVGDLAVAIGEWVVTDLRRDHPRMETLVRTGFANALEAYMGRVLAVTGEVITLANERLGMSAQVPRIVQPLDERPRFFFKDWDYAGGPLRAGGWRWRLPRRFAEPSARAALRELLERRIRQNLEAMSFDWGARLDDAVRGFSRASGQQLEAILRLLTRGLERAEKFRADGTAHRRREELELDLARVRGLRDRLELAESRAAARPGVGSG